MDGGGSGRLRAQAVYRCPATLQRQFGMESEVQWPESTTRGRRCRRRPAPDDKTKSSATSTANRTGSDHQTIWRAPPPKRERRQGTESGTTPRTKEQKLYHLRRLVSCRIGNCDDEHNETTAARETMCYLFGRFRKRRQDQFFHQWRWLPTHVPQRLLAALAGKAHVLSNLSTPNASGPGTHALVIDTESMKIVWKQLLSIGQFIVSKHDSIRSEILFAPDTALCCKRGEGLLCKESTAATKQ